MYTFIFCPKEIILKQISLLLVTVKNTMLLIFNNFGCSVNVGPIMLVKDMSTLFNILLHQNELTELGTMDASVVIIL